MTADYLQTAHEAERYIVSVRKRMTQDEAADWCRHLIYSPPAPNWTEEAREKWLAFYAELTG